ncbi:MAG: hypothetical protein U0Y10_01935 [Spirosomataceae bacterium]
MAKRYYNNAIKQWVILWLSLVASGQILAQTATNSVVAAQKVKATTALPVDKLLPQLTPKSPNVAAMAKYIEQPVSYYTGLPTIEIPLHTVSVGSLQVPITLSYHASGNRVNDMASWVGLGWSLKAGGAITRNVKGLPDESSTGTLGRSLISSSSLATFLNNSYTYNATSQPCLSNQVKADFYEVINGGTDVERDMFSYMTPSGSNSFVLVPAPSGSPNYRWQQADNARLSYSTGLGSFQLSNEAGVLHTFSDIESTLPNGGTAYTSAWLLTSMKGIKPTEQVLFSYQQNQQVNYTVDIADSETYYYEVGGTNKDAEGEKQLIFPGLKQTTNSRPSSFVGTKLLKEITFPEGKIVFTLSSFERYDGLGKALNSIEVYGYNVSTNGYSLIKKFVFEYTNGYTLFLRKVRMVDTDNNTVGSYSFEYNPIDLPPRDSRAKDYWGYFNNQLANSTLLPSQSISLREYTNSPNMTTYQIGSSSPTGQGANRQPNEDYMKAKVLTKITYPTGGFTTYDYEAHRYQDAGLSKIAGGLRVKQIVSTDGNGKTITKTLKYGTNQSGYGTLRDLSSTFYTSKTHKIESATVRNDPFANGGVNYTYKTVTYSSGFVQAINPNEGSPVTYPEITEYEDDGAGSNGKTVYLFKDDEADLLYSVPTTGSQSVKSRHWKRGQLLTKTTYGADGKKKHQVNNTYTLLVNDETPMLGYLIGKAKAAESGSYENGSGCLIDDDDFRPIVTYNWSVGTLKLSKTQELFFDQLDDTQYTEKVSYTSYMPTYYYPRVTQQIMSDGTVKGQTFYYAADYNLSSQSLSGEMLGIKRLQERNALATPIEEITYFKNSFMATDSTIGQTKITPFTVKDIAGINVWVLPKSIALIESQSLSFFNGSPFTPSAVLYNQAPSTYTDALPKHSAYDTKLLFSNYDDYGNLTSYYIVNKRSDAMSYQHISHDGLTLSLLTSQTKDVGGLAHVSSFAYEVPLLGVKAMTEPNQLVSNYEYDTFGRLKNIRNTDNQIVKSYQYHFKTATAGIDGGDGPVACPFYPTILNVSPVYPQTTLNQKACSAIELKPGFEAKTGAVYQASISNQ